MLSTSKLSRMLSIGFSSKPCSIYQIQSCSRVISNMTASLNNQNQLHQNGSSRRHNSNDHRTSTKCMKIEKTHDNGFMTIPNALTCSRIMLTPAIGYYIWTGLHSHALFCFSLAAVTDLLDGLIARNFNQSSRVGAILDPIADKFLLTTCFVALHHAQLMPVWLVGAFIGRDMGLLIGGALLRYRSFSEQSPSFGQFLDFARYPATPEFEPTFISKINTALQCLLIVTHLITHNHTGNPTYDVSITALHALTASTTVFSMSQYALRASRSSLGLRKKIT